jgi:hypothetical protein
MYMIDVLKRLEELDTKNPNINNPLAAGTKVRVQENTPPQLPDLTDLTELKALSGLKPVAECGMMGMSPMGDSHPPVATFSINATAAGGDEVASMLTQIMNLAGVHKVGPQHMPGVDGGATTLTSTPAMSATPMDTPISKIAAHGDSGEIMRAMMDKMNDPPEDEGYMSEPVTLMKDPGYPEPSTDPNPATPTTSPSTTDMINTPKTDYSLGAGSKTQKNYSLGDPNSFINKGANSNPPEDEGMMGDLKDKIFGKPVSLDRVGTAPEDEPKGVQVGQPIPSNKITPQPISNTPTGVQTEPISSNKVTSYSLDKPEDESMGMGQEGDMGSMADEIRGMADELSDMDPEDIGADAETDEGSIVGGVWTADPPKQGQPDVPAPSDPDGGILNKKTPPPKTTPPPKKTSDSGQGDQTVADAYKHPMRKMMDMLDNESYDNTPADPNNIPAHDSNKMSYNPNAGGHNKGVMNQPSAMAETLADQLFSDYKKFVAEGERTMSRAAKGYEKYGKQGMAALAKAGKEGKDLDKIRNKYDKYNEASMPMKKVGGKSVPAFAADGKGKNDLSKKKTVK